MQKTISIIIFSSLIILQTALSQDYQLKHLFDVGSDENDLFFGVIRDIQIDSEGNIYVLDSEAFTVTKLSPEGQLIAQAGRHGEAPGEFAHTLKNIVVTDQGIIVQSNRMMHYFNLDLVYQDRLAFTETKISEMRHPLSIIYTGQEFVYSISPRAAIDWPSLIFHGDLAKGLLLPVEVDFKDFAPSEISGIYEPMVNWIKLAISPQGTTEGSGKIYISALFIMQNRIEIYDSNFNAISSFSVPDLSQEPIFTEFPLQGITQKMPDPILSGISISSKNEIWVTDKKSNIYIFDVNGVFIQQINPSGKRLLAQTKDRLYFVSEESTVLSVYTAIR